MPSEPQVYHPALGLGEPACRFTIDRRRLEPGERLLLLSDEVAESAVDTTASRSDSTASADRSRMLSTLLQPRRPGRSKTRLRARPPIRYRTTRGSSCSVWAVRERLQYRVCKSDALSYRRTRERCPRNSSGADRRCRRGVRALHRGPPTRRHLGYRKQDVGAVAVLPALGRRSGRLPRALSGPPGPGSDSFCR